MLHILIFYKTHLLNKSDNFSLGVEVFPEDSEYSDPLTLLVYTKRPCKILGRISDLTYTSTLRENCPRVFLVRFSHIRTEYGEMRSISTEYFSVFSSNAGKDGPENLRIRTLFMHFKYRLFSGKNVSQKFWHNSYENTIPQNIMLVIEVYVFIFPGLLEEISFNNLLFFGY